MSKTNQCCIPLNLSSTIMLSLSRSLLRSNLAVEKTHKPKLQPTAFQFSFVKKIKSTTEKTLKCPNMFSRFKIPVRCTSTFALIIELYETFMRPPEVSVQYQKMASTKNPVKSFEVFLYINKRTFENSLVYLLENSGIDRQE